MKTQTLTILFSAATLLMAAQKTSTSPVTGTKTEHPLETVATLDVRPGNVSVSQTGRVFATIHPLGNPKNQLVEIIDGKAIPYPTSTLQKNGQKATDATFDTPLGLASDRQNRLWMIDMGLELGTSRLWCFDLAQNKVVEKIELPADIAPKGSFIQDLAIDELNGWAYLADIANPGIVVIDLKSKKARRFGNHPSLQSENKDMVIDGKVVNFNGSAARVAINPITLSADKETLYFGAMNGSVWYKLPAKLFREQKDDQAIGNGIQQAGAKPFSDGAATDAKGNHYFTDLAQHGISKLSSDGKLSLLFSDPKIQWPDNLALSPNGYLYMSVNQLNTTPAFTGAADEGKAPYYIFRYKLKN
jgi:sugar lactone lactonase YvrE